MSMQAVNFDSVTAGLTTKSDKIRALARSGAATKDIARYLDIRYQHARNVLVQSGLHRVANDDQSAARTDKDVCDGWVNLDRSGMVQLPPPIVAAAGLAAGPVHLRVTADGVEIISRQAALKRARDIVAPFVPPGTSLVDELIAERRREARDE